MSSRRQARAGASAAAAGIPARIARFRLEDWPPAAAVPDGTLTGPGAARFYARRRWYHAQQAHAGENGMSISQLRHLITAGRV